MSYIVTAQTQAPSSAQSQADRTTKLLDPKVAIPPIDQVNLPSTLATWPRIEWSTVKFTYPDFLFMPGMLQEKFQWTARDASRAWDEALKHSNLNYALAPAHRGHLQPGTTEYDKAIELSLSLAYADKALQLYVIRPHYTNWITGITGLGALEVYTKFDMSRPTTGMRASGDSTKCCAGRGTVCVRIRHHTEIGIP